MPDIQIKVNSCYAAKMQAKEIIQKQFGFNKKVQFLRAIPMKQSGYICFVFYICFSLDFKPSQRSKYLIYGWPGCCNCFIVCFSYISCT